MKDQFKLLMVKPLEGCSQHLLKVLECGEPYFLYSSYLEENNWIKRDEKSDAIPLNFFTEDPNMNPLISISAIVGKNGDGKSSLIELIIRIINNFAKIYGFGGDTENLIYVEGINAELFFSLTNETNEIIYKIQIRSKDTETIYLFKDNLLIWSIEFIIQKNIPKFTKRFPEKYGQKERGELIPDYFFTIVANYSLYAYNPYDFSDEWVWIEKIKNRNEIQEIQASWLDSVFHKNDGYQTPIVLHPYRTKGNININTEQKLTTQRLLTLFLTDDEGLNSFRWINERQYAESIEYTLIEDSIVDNKVFYDFFRSTFYYNSYQDNSAPPLKDIDDEVDKQLKLRNLDINQQLLKKIEIEIIRPIENISKLITSNSKIFNRANAAFRRVVEDLKKERDESQNIHRESDIQIYIGQVKTIFSKAKRILTDDIKQRLYKSTNNILKNLESLNFNQYFQVALVIFIQEEWKNRIPHLDKSMIQLNEVEKGLGNKAFDYILYKTLSIIRKYPQYKHWYRFSYFQGYILENAEMTSFEKEGYQHAINDILSDESHITLKLRQTLNLLNYNFYTQEEHDSELYKNYIHLFRLQDEQIEEIIDGKRCFKQIRVRRYNFTNYYNTIRNIYLFEDRSTDHSKLMDLLPPPIFNQDAILFDKTKNNKSRLSKLSSGEKQLISTVSSVLYHFRNINSVIPKYLKTIDKEEYIYQYRHLNLIFEEIELYFHPEYQRKFIKYLIERISRIKLSNIHSINICLVTHSPFILSDIPINNVLFLEKGRPKPTKQGMNTFSANFYDLLSYGFFLEAPMGEFAASIIEKILKDLKEKEVNSQNKNKYEQLINLIGDRFLQMELKSKLYQVIGGENAFEISQLEKRLKYLRGE